MARTGMLLLLLLGQFVTSALLVNVTQIRVYPEHGSVYGVFHVSMPSGYAFNSSVAKGVCTQLGVTIADKGQVSKAQEHGFETCKFGWIDEQVTVIPRIRPKESCGKGQVGVITWRAPLRTPFDVFCFNSTDYEAQLNKAQEKPSTTTTTIITSTAHASATPTAQAETTHSDLQTSSFSPPDSEDMPELQPFSNTSPTTAVGLIALLTTVFAFLLLTLVAVCYIKKNSVGRWSKSQKKETIETEICEKARKESQAEVTNEDKIDKTSETDDVRVTIKPENDDNDDDDGDNDNDDDAAC